MIDAAAELFGNLGDVPGLIRLVGLAGVAAIVFVETGLLVGFFLPGDSLLLTAGVFAARGDLDLAWLLVWTTIAAVLGDATGYALGRRAGRALYGSSGSSWLRREHLRLARAYYERHGGVTIVLARFVPLLRTLAPVVAGAAAMPYRRFAFWNVTGGALWVSSLCGAGYLLGLAMPDLEERLSLVIAGVVLLTLAGVALSSWRERHGRRHGTRAAAGRRPRRAAPSLRRVLAWATAPASAGRSTRT